MKKLRLCVICGFPDSASPLYRMTWKDTPATPSTGIMDIVVAKSPRDGDVLVCEQCIRGIKRIPFSDLESVELPF